MMSDAFSAITLGAMRAGSRRFDTIANNIANFSTAGFRRQQAVSSEVVLARGGASISMSHITSALTETQPGAMKRTGGPLDLAIGGQGYFAVDSASGTFLTRNGAFSRSAEGLMVDSEGRAVLGAGGAPIALPEDGGTLSIASDGTLTSNGEIIGRIAVFAADPSTLERRAGASFAMPDDAVELEDPEVLQGTLEGSNVDPVSEIAAMIETSRAYESLQSLAERDDERARNVIERFSRST